MDFLNLFIEHRFWAWLSVAAILLAAELLIGTSHLLWLSVAAAINAFLLMLVPNSSIAVDLVLYGILAISSVWLGFKFFPITTKIENNINAPVSRLIGQNVIANEDFQSGLGSVKLGDTRWRALCQTANPKNGDELIIEKVEGATLFVNVK